MKLMQKDRNRLIIPLRVAYALTITQIDDVKTYIFTSDVHVDRYTKR